MIVEYTRYRVPSAQREAFEVALESASDVVRRSSHCLGCELAQSTEKAGDYVLRIAWAVESKQLDELHAAGEFAKFTGLTSPYDTMVVDTHRYEPTAAAGQAGSVPSLYEWAGGAAAFERLTATFYDAVRKDDQLAPLFAEMDSNHPHYVALWLGEVFGGPARYTAERGGYHAMLSHHLGKGITEAQRRRWVQLLLDAADRAVLPSDPEFRAAFVAYIEWGTRLALANSQPGAKPPQHAPTPRWGWGMAPPYQG